MGRFLLFSATVFWSAAVSANSELSRDFLQETLDSIPNVELLDYDPASDCIESAITLTTAEFEKLSGSALALSLIHI